MDEGSHLLRFGVFVLDPRTGELRKSGTPVKLQQRPSRVLALLASHPDQLLTREEIQSQVWPEGTFVDFELGLNTCIRQIRVALGDDAETPRFVQTIPRRGYRFVSPVERVPIESPAAPDRVSRRWPWWGVAVAAAVGVVASVVLVRSVRSRSTVAQSSPVSYRRLTCRRGTVCCARFGPDDRVVYGAAWDGPGHDLYEGGSAEGGEGRRLGVDGDHVVAVSKRGEMAFLRGSTLIRAPLMGGLPKEILGGVWAADWTPDGADFAVAHTVGDHVRIEFPIGTPLCDAVRPSHLRLSPDHARLAFLEHPMPGDDRGSVALVDRGGRKRTLSRGWSSIEGLAWSPAGDEVWFTATRVGTDTSVYAVDLEGNERQVAPAMGRLVLQDIAPDGKVLLARGDARAEIRYRGEGENEERDLSWLDFSTLQDISSDGRTILFEESGEGGGPRYGIYLRRTDGSPAVRVGEGVAKALSPDGNWVLAVPLDAPDRLEVIPVGKGMPRTIQDPGIARYRAAQWLPSGKAFVFSGADREGATRIYWRALDAGPPRPITPVGVYSDAARSLSPDGRDVVGRCGERYCLYSVEDPAAPPRAIEGVGLSYRPLYWGDGGKALFFTEMDKPFLKVFRLDLGSHRLALWRTPTPPDRAGFQGLFAFLTSTDGRAYAYSYGRLTSELYLVRGLV